MEAFASLVNDDVVRFVAFAAQLATHNAVVKGMAIGDSGINANII